MQGIGTHVCEHNMIMTSQKKEELKQASSSGGAVLRRDDVVDDEDLLPWIDRNGFPNDLFLSLQGLRPFFKELASVRFHPIESGPSRGRVLMVNHRTARVAQHFESSLAGSK